MESIVIGILVTAFFVVLTLVVMGFARGVVLAFNYLDRKNEKRRYEEWYRNHSIIGKKEIK